MTSPARRAADELARAREIRFYKACRCKATATTGMFRFRTEPASEVVNFVITFVPGPSCDECGKAWKVRAYRKAVRG